MPSIYRTLAPLAAACAFSFPLCVTAAVFGAPMPPGDAQRLSVALADQSSFGAPKRKFSGRVTQVCQAKGCWMMLEDDGLAARVTMHGHSFSLPKDASGAAVVYGVLEQPSASAKLAAGTGGNTPAASEEFRITAYSVELAD